VTVVGVDAVDWVGGTVSVTCIECIGYVGAMEMEQINVHVSGICISSFFD